MRKCEECSYWKLYPKGHVYATRDGKYGGCFLNPVVVGRRGDDIACRHMLVLEEA